MVWDTDLICWSVGHDDPDDRDFNHIKGVFYYQHGSQREVYVFQRVFFSSHGNSQDQKNTFKKQIQVDTAPPLEGGQCSFECQHLPRFLTFHRSAKQSSNHH